MPCSLPLSVSKSCSSSIVAGFVAMVLVGVYCLLLLTDRRSLGRWLVWIVLMCSRG